jgi:hypothetical protein
MSSLHAMDLTWLGNEVLNLEQMTWVVHQMRRSGRKVPLGNKPICWRFV